MHRMKVVDLGGDEGGKVLLVKQKGKISALGTKCTHYGAPLVNGHLGDGRIRCQWHGACFNIANGMYVSNCIYSIKGKAAVKRIVYISTY